MFNWEMKGNGWESFAIASNFLGFFPEKVFNVAIAAFAFKLDGAVRVDHLECNLVTIHSITDKTYLWDLTMEDSRRTIMNVRVDKKVQPDGLPEPRIGPGSLTGLWRYNDMRQQQVVIQKFAIAAIKYSITQFELNAVPIP